MDFVKTANELHECTFTPNVIGQNYDNTGLSAKAKRFYAKRGGSKDGKENRTAQPKVVERLQSWQK